MKKILFFMTCLYSLTFGILTNQPQLIIFFSLALVVMLAAHLSFLNIEAHPYLKLFGIIISLAYLFMSHLQHLVIQPFTVKHSSMEPYLHPGDHVIVEKISMGIVINLPGSKKVARRIHLPWFRELKTGDVVILKNPVTRENIIKRIGSVENGKYCVFGDNPGVSLDSRTFGCIAQEEILGRMIYRLRIPDSRHG